MLFDSPEPAAEPLLKSWEVALGFVLCALGAALELIAFTAYQAL